MDARLQAMKYPELINYAKELAINNFGRYVGKPSKELIIEKIKLHLEEQQTAQQQQKTVAPKTPKKQHAKEVIASIESLPQPQRQSKRQSACANTAATPSKLTKRAVEQKIEEAIKETEEVVAPEVDQVVTRKVKKASKSEDGSGKKLKKTKKSAERVATTSKTPTRRGRQSAEEKAKPRGEEEEAVKVPKLKLKKVVAMTTEPEIVDGAEKKVKKIKKKAAPLDEAISEAVPTAANALDVVDSAKEAKEPAKKLTKKKSASKLKKQEEKVAAAAGGPDLVKKRKKVKKSPVKPVEEQQQAAKSETPVAPASARVVSNITVVKTPAQLADDFNRVVIQSPVARYIIMGIYKIYALKCLK